MGNDQGWKQGDPTPEGWVGGPNLFAPVFGSMPEHIQEVEDVLNGTDHCMYCGKVHRVVTLSKCEECGAVLCNLQTHYDSHLGPAHLGWRHTVYQLRSVRRTLVTDLHECGPTVEIERFETDES